MGKFPVHHHPSARRSEFCAEKVNIPPVCVVQIAGHSLLSPVSSGGVLPNWSRCRTALLSLIIDRTRVIRHRNPVRQLLRRTLAQCDDGGCGFCAAPSVRSMRFGWLVAVLLCWAGCATQPASKSSPDFELFPRFVWPEWTPITLGLVESTEVDGRTMMIVYPRRATSASETPATTPGFAPPNPSGARASPASAAASPSPTPPAPLPPQKEREPAENVELGQSVTFAASADGSPPFSFEWRKNGKAIPGETAARITIKAARESDAGTYDCIVKNSAGQATSAPIILVVRKR
jgi:hypothetical protein